MKAKTIDEIVDLNSSIFGDKIAYSHEGRTISFSDLGKYTDNIADKLVKLGVKGNEPVAIYMERCLQFIVSIYGIIKSGNAYMPLDSDDKSERIFEIIDVSKVRYIITKSEYFDIFVSNNVVKKNNINIIVISDDFILESAEQVAVANNIRTPISGNSIAYILYTSGTTGSPKGVAISHNNVMNYIESSNKVMLFNSETKIFSNKSFCFDASITDIFCTFAVGGTMYFNSKQEVLPRRILQNIKKFGLTHVSFTPVVFKLMVYFDKYSQEDFATVKTISMGGDVIEPEHINKFLNKIKGISVFNRYGPTECTVVSSCFKAYVPVDGDKVPIGTPLDNITYYIIKDGEIVEEDNIEGELYIGGKQVMLKYWNNETVTSQVLFDNIVKNDILYKTGDLVYRRNDGNYVFVGRNNDIVKKNGYRINLNEIKSIALRCDDIEDCVCLFDDERQIIVLFVKTVLEIVEIMEFLKVRISPFMIPDSVKIVDSIPYTNRGKVDKKSLMSLLG